MAGGESQRNTPASGITSTILIFEASCKNMIIKQKDSGY